MFHILVVQVFNRRRASPTFWNWTRRVASPPRGALCYRVSLLGRWLPCGLAFLLHPLPHRPRLTPVVTASIGMSCRMRHILSGAPSHLPPLATHLWPNFALSTWIYCLKIRWKYLIGSQSEWGAGAGAGGGWKQVDGAWLVGADLELRVAWSGKTCCRYH